MDQDWTFVIDQPAVATTPWAIKPVQPPPPAFANDEALKKSFGIELVKAENNAFTAACAIFPDDMPSAIWIASHWLADPAVTAAKDIYQNSLDAEALLLDKDAFAVMLMKTAMERDPVSRRYRVEAKERVNLLKLYADVRGFTGKTEISNNLNLTNNEMKVVFVKSDTPKATAPIELKSEIVNDYQTSDLKIKLVR
jgi:hypothetical protein